VAKVFAALRVTGQVSTGVARELLAQLQAFTEACEAEGVEVKQSVDVTGLEPEPVPVVGGLAVPELPADFALPSLEELESELKKSDVQKIVIPKAGKGAK
jgi:hypothetical protein